MVEALCQNTVKTEAFSFFLQTVQTFACEGAESHVQRSFISKPKNNLSEKACSACGEKKEKLMKKWKNK